jgi:hypothetical protein
MNYSINYSCCVSPVIPDRFSFKRIALSKINDVSTSNIKCLINAFDIPIDIDSDIDNEDLNNLFSSDRCVYFFELKAVKDKLIDAINFIDIKIDQDEIVVFTDHNGGCILVFSSKDSPVSDSSLLTHTYLDILDMSGILRNKI